MKTNREFRARMGIELRAATAEEKAKGYIGALCGEIPFNTDSAPLSERGVNRGQPFIEQIAPDAFKLSRSEDGDVMGFAGHTQDPLSAFARMGENLVITEDEKSLRYRALVPDTAAGRDLITLTEKKIIRGTSFEFSLRSGGEKWSKRGDVDVRTVTDAQLFTVNPVAFPAYPGSELTSERGAPGGAVFYIDVGGGLDGPALEKIAAFVHAESAREAAAAAEALKRQQENFPETKPDSSVERRLRVLSLAPKF
jgi:HK97 family phage prohead protease